MRSSMQILLMSAIVTSCSWSNHNNDGDHGNENPGPVLESCDSVVTEEAIAAYHSSQSQFRVESAGWDVSCRAYVVLVRCSHQIYRVFQHNSSIHS